MAAIFMRQENLTYSTFLTTISKPFVEQLHGVILDVEREPTARESVKKFFFAVKQEPAAVIRMGAVGMKIDGRSSCFDLWHLPGVLNQYAVDVKDDSFVAKTCSI